eukprot:UC4_evm1s1326
MGGNSSKDRDDQRMKPVVSTRKRAISKLHKVDPNLEWKIKKVLGKGSYGQVHLVSRIHPIDTSADPTARNDAAAKKMPIASGNDLKAARVEVDILSKLKHNGIIQLVGAYIYDGGEGDELWILLEACPGGSLKDIQIRDDRGFNEKECQCVAFQLFTALAYLHASRVIHRDINCSNIMLQTDGQCKLADFGVSTEFRGSQAKRVTFIGSPNWMAPEVIVCERNHDNPYGTAADIWSAGITIIEAAQTRAPYHDLHPMKAMLKICNGKPPSFDEPHNYSQDFVDFVKYILVKNPSDRPCSDDIVAQAFSTKGKDPGHLELRSKK